MTLTIPIEPLKNPLWILRTLSRNHLFLANAADRQVVKTVLPYTLLGVARLRSLLSLAKSIVADQVEGAFVECGCRNGGSGALLASVASGEGRATWLFDSFEGLPAPSIMDITAFGKVGRKGDYSGSESQVREVLARVGVQPSDVHITKGWFENTLLSSHTGPIALLHVDVDLHDSVLTVLEAFYDRVAPGGILVLDDYGYWRGFQRAVDTFLRDRVAQPRIRRSAYPSVWFRKPLDTADKHRH